MDFYCLVDSFRIEFSKKMTSCCCTNNAKAGNWRSMVISGDDGSGSIDFYRSETQYPRFQLSYNVQNTPAFSLLQENETTGFLEGSPIFSGSAFQPVNNSFCHTFLIFNL